MALVALVSDSGIATCKLGFLAGIGSGNEFIHTIILATIR